MARLSGVLVLLVLLALLAGCGGSRSPADEALRGRATAVCATAARRAGRIPTPSSARRSIAYLNRGVAALKSELAGLRALRPASDDAAEVYNASLAALSREIAALQRTTHKLRSGEDPVVAWRTLQQRLGPLESSQDTGWRALQVPACLSG